MRDLSHPETVFTLFIITIFMLSYGLTIGTVAWVYSTEILTEQGMGLAVAVHWVTNFLIFWLRNFAIFLDTTHKADEDLDYHTSYFFFIYSTVCLASYFVILVFVKESGGRTREETNEVFKSTIYKPISFLSD